MSTGVSLPFVVDDEATDHDARDQLTSLQRAQLDSAMTFHCLVHPGATIRFRVTIGLVDEMPRLTDGSATLSEGGSGEPVLAITATSTATGASATASPAVLVRTIRLSHPDATPATTQPAAMASAPRRLYSVLERTTPMLTDDIREAITGRRERGIASPLPRYPGNPEGAAVAEATAHAPGPITPPNGAPRAVLFGLHWLQTGGAERWAIESIALAKAAGLLPIVVADHDSVHPWLLRPELEDCIVICQSFGDDEQPFDMTLMRALLENYDVRGAVIHHSDWLYRSLPYLAQHRPDTPVVDSLHIVEYLRGGYAGIAVEYDAFIDTHHVISPQLVHWLSKTQGITPEKIELAPLNTLTAHEARDFRERDAARPLTLAFIGRFSRQKRPDLFLTLVHRLRRRGMPFRAIMQGDGERRDLVEALLDRLKLRDVIELRDEGTPVADTLAETDLLVITSINEGLTLTTFEAVAAGVPVLSTDVGSQDTVVQGSMLLPRPARPFLRQAVDRIEALTGLGMLGADEAEHERRRVWQAQRDRVQAFSEHTGAHDYFERLFTQWQA